MATRKRAERRPQTDDRRPPTASDLTGLPTPAALAEGWEVARLGDLVTKTKQIDPNKTSNWKFKYVDVSSVDNTRLKITGYAEHQSDSAPSRARKLIKANDVLFATVRLSLKRVAMVPPDLDGYIW